MAPEDVPTETPACLVQPDPREIYFSKSFGEYFGKPLPIEATNRTNTTMPDAIEHVIVLMFENRSFDQVLGCYQALRGGVDGVDLQNLRKVPSMDKGITFRQAASKARTINPGPSHESRNVQAQLHLPPRERNRGFVIDYQLANHVVTKPQVQEIMNYYDPGDLPAMHGLADSFTICDHWYASVPGPTWTNRFFVHSGTSLGLVHMPTGLSLPWDTYVQTTAYDQLNAAGVPWRIYYGDFPQSLLLVHQHENRNLKRYRPLEELYTDFADEGAKFPNYVFIEPHYFPLTGQNDYHPPSNVLNGEALLARVYNALRQSPIWERSLLIVTFDEHGGFYDHIYPPDAEPPDEHQDEYNFNQYGLRVPTILVSPLIPPGVDNTVYDHTSILAYLTKKYGLGSLGARVAHAKTFDTAIGTTPRTDTPVQITSKGSKLTKDVGDPSQARPDVTQAAAVTYTVYLEDGPLTTEDERRVRMMLQQQGTDAQFVAAMNRVRSYLDKAQLT